MNSKIQLTPGEIQILNQPFSQDHAKEAFMLGIATSLSEAGLVPSQVEEMLRKVGAPGEEEASNIIDHFKNYSLAWLAAGAGVGAGAAYLHHNIDQNLAGNDDPEISKLRQKINEYHKLNQNLQVGV